MAARVLICDDAVAFGVLFEQWMKSGGFEVVGHADGAQEALALAAERRPDVIVIDHLLQDVTSDVLVPQLREAAPEARLLLISGMPERDLEGFAAAAGVDAYLSKAATAQAMCDAVSELAG